MIWHQDLNANIEFNRVHSDSSSIRWSSDRLAHQAYEACYRFRKPSQNSRLGNFGLFRAGEV